MITLEDLLEELEIRGWKLVPLKPGFGFLRYESPEGYHINIPNTDLPPKVAEEYLKKIKSTD